MFKDRTLSKMFRAYTKLPVVAILGPRQSGKTTLAQHFFKNHTYLSFEDPILREQAETDPQGLLNDHENKYGIILDEFQYVPKLLSYIQLDVDKHKRQGYFILTGSQNFLMNEKISQSLAGRVGILTLLPFSLAELSQHSLLAKRINNIIFKGQYPRIYDQKVAPTVFYRSYLQTYLQRDVRELINVGNLITFQKFMSLCAGRIGQQLNIADLATNCGISRESATEWLSILEASYILFQLKPHFKNFNKRITKTPKLYFYDTGLAATLLNLTSPEIIGLSPFRGPLFENLIIADFYKQFHNQGKEPTVYFWRDQNGRIEIDCIIDTGLELVPIEIKSGQTINSSYFDALNAWSIIVGEEAGQNYVVYAGSKNQTRKAQHIITLEHAGNLIEKIN